VRLSLVFHAFLARTALGVVLSLIPLWRMRAAERHLRFQTLLALVLAGGAAALYLPALGATHPDAPRGVRAFLSPDAGMPGALVLLCVACLAVNLFYGTFRRGAGRVALVVASLLGAVAVVGTARLVPGASSAGAVAALTIGGVLGGLVVGSVTNAMILGHFYLMIRGLPLEALRVAGRFVVIAVVLRILFFAGLLAFDAHAREVLLGSEVVWTAWRVAFGFVGPLVLIWMVKDTVRLEHTQAATGLLYVAIGFALMGELAATWLEAHTGLPT
jgi:hypothetical protein